MSSHASFLEDVGRELDAAGVAVELVDAPEGRRWKAADISDLAMLRVVHDVCFARNLRASKWCVQSRFRGVPEKVVYAKLSRLLGRGLLDGCDCGCRGDWELTADGCTLLDAEPWVYDPVKGRENLDEAFRRNRERAGVLDVVEAKVMRG